MTETQSLGLGAVSSDPGGRKRIPVNGVVVIVFLAGAAAVLGVSLISQGWETPDYLLDSSDLWPYLTLVLLAMLAEIVYVPTQHGDATEDLTFFEVLVVAATLVFAPAVALILPLVGFVIADTLLGRPARKTIFNVGSFALATSALVLIFGSQAAAVDRFSIQWLGLLFVGVAAFTAINLLLLAWILYAAEGLPIGEFLSDQWRLSVTIGGGSAATAVLVVALGTTAPVLIPFSAFPAAALWYNYRAAQQRNEALERNRWMLRLNTTLSQLTSPEELIPKASDELRRVFLAAGVIVIVGDTSYRMGEAGGLPEPGPVSGEDRLLLAAAGDKVERLPEELLPDGWTRGYSVSLSVADDESSALFIGSPSQSEALDKILPWAKGEWNFKAVDSPVLASLAASLSSAVRAGQHLEALRDETAKLSAVVDNATDGIVVVDNSEVVQVWSPAMERITGFDATSADLPDAANKVREQVVGLAREARMPLSDQENAQVGFEHALGIVREDGESRELSVSVVPIALPGVGASNDEEIMSVLTIRDMTRERRIERMKSDFIATVSHELKTPITPIKGYSQHLLTRWDRLEPEKRERMLQTMVERADHLSRLVEDLLIASRVSELETTKLDIRSTEIQLSDIVNDVTAASPELADRLSVSGPDTQVFCDRQRAVQCLSNLVSNAKKYSEEGTEILITTEVPADGEFATVAVRDHGRGIPAEEVGRVFEQFYRVEDPMTMTTGGTGLGLYISRTLARAMGGDISVQSEYGQGSTFELSLPRTQVSEGGTA